MKKATCLVAIAGLVLGLSVPAQAVLTDAPAGYGSFDITSPVDIVVESGTLDIDASVTTTGGVIPDAIRHYGYHYWGPDGMMDLDNNNAGGMMGGGNPMVGPGFFGQAILTDGPGGRGLDFNGHDDFIATGVIGQPFNYCNMWLGTFTAAESGTHEFRSMDSFTWAGIWIDLDQDGVFKSTTPGLGSDRGEQLSWEDDGWPGWWPVTLTAGESYLVAFTQQRDSSGGWPTADFAFRTPSIGGETRVKPADPAQAGLWSIVVPSAAFVQSGATLNILDGGALTTGAVNVSGTMNADGVVTADTINVNGTVNADGVVTADTINVRGTVNADGVVTADTINVKGRYNANAAGSADATDVFIAAGGTFGVNFDGAFTGSAVTVGGTLDISADGGVNGATITAQSGGYVNVSTAQTIFPNITLTAGAGLGGDLTGATYGAGNAVQLAPGAVITPTAGNEPTAAEAGGATLYRGVTDLAGTYNVGADGTNPYKGVAFEDRNWSPDAFTGTVTSAPGTDVDVRLATDVTFDGTTLNSDTTVANIEIVEWGRITLRGGFIVGTATQINISGDNANREILRLYGDGAIRDGLTVNIAGGRVGTAAWNNIKGTLEVGTDGTLYLNNWNVNFPNTRIDVLSRGVLRVSELGCILTIDPSKVTFADDTLMWLHFDNQTFPPGSWSSQILLKSNFGWNDNWDFRGDGFRIGNHKYAIGRWSGQQRLNSATSSFGAEPGAEWVGFAAFNNQWMYINEPFDAAGADIIVGSETSMMTTTSSSDMTRHDEIPSGGVEFNAPVTNAGTIFVKSGHFRIDNAHLNGQTIVVSGAADGIGGGVQLVGYHWRLATTEITVEGDGNLWCQNSNASTVLGTLHLNNASGLTFGDGKSLQIGTRLTGTGSVRPGNNGRVVVMSGATLEPGKNGIGTLGLDDLHLQGGTQYVWELGPASNDVVNVADALVLGSTWDLVVTDAMGATESGDKHTLFNYGGALSTSKTGDALDSVRILRGTGLPSYYNLGSAVVKDDGSRIYITGIKASDLKFWRGAGAGNWDTRTSWNRRGEPLLFAKAIIAKSGSTVTVDTAANVAWRLVVDNDAGLSVSAGGQLSVSDTTTVTPTGVLSTSGSGEFNSFILSSSGTTALGGTGTFGTLNVTDGTTTVSSQLDVTDMTVNSAATLNASAGIAAGGTLTLDGTTVNVTGVADFSTGTGSTSIKNAPDLDIAAAGHLTIQAGGAAFGALTMAAGAQLTLDEDGGPGTGAASFDSISGQGAIHGAVIVTGSLTPGNSVGTISVDGDLTLADGAAYDAEIIGAIAADSLVSAGTVTLGANTWLNVIPEGGDDKFLAGSSYVLVDADAVSGTFANVTPLGTYVTGDGLTYDAAGGTVTLTLELNLNPGDGNLDGATDVSDRIIWNTNNFTFNTTFTTGDFNNDGATDVSDRIIWNSNNFTFASAAPAGPIAAEAAGPPSGAPKFIYDFTTGVMRVEANGNFLTEIVVNGNEGVSLLNMIPFMNTRNGFVLWAAQNFNGKFQAYDNASNGDSGDFVLAEFALALDENDFLDGVDWGSVPEIGQPGGSGNSPVTIVPEPATLALLGLGGMVVLARRRRRK